MIVRVIVVLRRTAVDSGPELGGTETKDPIELAPRDTSPVKFAGDNGTVHQTNDNWLSG